MALLFNIAATIGLLSKVVLAAPRNVPPKISGDVQVLGHTFDPGFGQGNASNPNDPGYVGRRAWASINRYSLTSPFVVL